MENRIVQLRQEVHRKDLGSRSGRRHLDLNGEMSALKHARRAMRFLNSSQPSQNVKPRSVGTTPPSEHNDTATIIDLRSSVAAKDNETRGMRAQRDVGNADLPARSWGTTRRPDSEESRHQRIAGDDSLVWQRQALRYRVRIGGGRAESFLEGEAGCRRRSRKGSCSRQQSRSRSPTWTVVVLPWVLLALVTVAGAAVAVALRRKARLQPGTSTLSPGHASAVAAATRRPSAIEFYLRSTADRMNTFNSAWRSPDARSISGHWSTAIVGAGKRTRHRCCW